MEDRRAKLVEYFKKNLAKGYTEDSLKWILIQQGYSRTDITRALEKLEKFRQEEERSRAKDKERPKIKYQLYGADNKPIKIEERKPFSWKKFFRKFRG
jgi:uncharacterized protein Smg (DUF494 family)|tara:strand:+ start:300 stop:593 length:294 start_codon:yes stop_codon:yes gene_type:complete